MIRRSQAAYDRAERALELPMLVLSLAFVPIVAAPVLVSLSDATLQALEFASWAIWAAFVVEYVTLLYLAPSRWQMVRTHLFDLAIILLPFLRPLRAARSLRLLRALVGLGRAGVAVRRVTERRGFRAFVLVVALLIVAGGILAYGFERNHPDANITSVAEGVWWALVTATTVGYGDHFPVSAEGRGVAIVLMLVGIGLLSVVTANIAAFFIQEDGHDETDERLARIEARLAELMELVQNRDTSRLE